MNRERGHDQGRREQKGASENCPRTIENRTHVQTVALTIVGFTVFAGPRCEEDVLSTPPVMGFTHGPRTPDREDQLLLTQGILTSPAIAINAGVSFCERATCIWGAFARHGIKRTTGCLFPYNLRATWRFPRTLFTLTSSPRATRLLARFLRLVNLPSQFAVQVC